MNDERKNEILIDQIEQGIEGLLLSDEISDLEKASILTEMLSLIEKAKKEKRKI